MGKCYTIKLEVTDHFVQRDLLAVQGYWPSLSLASLCGAHKFVGYIGKSFIEGSVTSSFESI